MKTWTVPADLRSPAFAYERDEYGRAAIRRSRYEPGVYEMYGVKGYSHFELKQPIRVTSLQIDGKVWMVDDPVHWASVQEHAERIKPGKVLIAGLGLGLIIHALKDRDDIDRIVVVEREFDVHQLVWPLLPKTKAELILVERDFWQFASTVKPGEFDTMFVDLWVGNGAEIWRNEAHEAWDALDRRFGDETQIQMFAFPIADILSGGRDCYRQLVKLKLVDPQTGEIHPERFEELRAQGVILEAS